MARVETIVVGGGIGAVAPFTLNFIPFVSATDPASVSTTDFMFVVPTGANRALILNTAGTDPAAGPERLRVKGGTILLPATGTTGTCIGDGTDSGANGQILIGNAITPGAQANSIVIGNSAVGPSGGGGMVIGQGSQLTGAGVVINGTNTVASGAQNQTTINGTSTGGTNLNHVNIGAGCSITTGVVAVGGGTTVGSSASNCTAVGGGITATCGTGCTLIGAGCSITTNTFNNCIVIGNGAQAWQTRMISLGSNASLEPPTMMALGHGLNTVANPTAFLIRLTNASGTDNTAGALTLQAGLSTGNIVGPGVNLDAGIPGASGTTLQTARTWVSARPTTTATETGLMVWDVDNATLERVTVGAADSGGVGFKLLRIPN